MEQTSMETVHENLRYIRKTLDAAGRFTAVPGKGLMAAGFLALAGVELNLSVTGAPWDDGVRAQAALEVWGSVLILSLAVVSYGIYRKSRTTQTRLQAPLLRKLLWTLCPSLFVGAALTHVAVRTQDPGWMPVIWLGCYGAAVTNGSVVSVPPVRWLGLSLLGVAGCAALSPESLGLAWLAVGFGLLHLMFGAYIAWRHNG